MTRREFGWAALVSRIGPSRQRATSSLRERTGRSADQTTAAHRWWRLRMRKVPAFLAILLAVCTLDAHAEDAVRTTAEQLREQALVDSTAWDVMESLVTEVGPRPVGSPAMERARDWAITVLRTLGLQNVRAEEFIKENAWFRGKESAQVVAPHVHELSVLGLGNSVPTPLGGVEGEWFSFRISRSLPPPLSAHLPAG